MVDPTVALRIVPRSTISAALSRLTSFHCRPSKVEDGFVGAVRSLVVLVRSFFHRLPEGLLRRPEEIALIGPRVALHNSLDRLAQRIVRERRPEDRALEEGEP